MRPAGAEQPESLPPTGPFTPRPKTTVQRVKLRVWDNELACERLQGIGYWWECRSCKKHGLLHDRYREAALEQRAHRCDPWGDGR